MTKPIFIHQAHRGGGTSLRDYYCREGDDRFYSKIWAGIVPPSERPGAIVVVAEEFTLKPPAQIFFVDEAQESATDNLMQRALDFKALYQVQEFYGRRDRDFYRYLSFWNVNRREQKLKGLEISEAPNSSEANISFHIGVLRNRLSPNKKTLRLGESKLLPAAFQELSMSDVSTAKDTEHPVLAALGFCVSALDEYGADWETDRPTQAEIEGADFLDNILNQ